jgi:hypothetical protein
MHRHRRKNSEQNCRKQSLNGLHAWHTLGARVATTTTVTVLDKPNRNAGNVICTEAPGSLGTITGGPKSLTQKFVARGAMA